VRDLSATTGLEVEVAPVDDGTGAVLLKERAVPFRPLEVSENRGTLNLFIAGGELRQREEPAACHPALAFENRLGVGDLRALTKAPPKRLDTSLVQLAEVAAPHYP